MAVITISRQRGSAGDYIANLVASTLSYKLVNKQSLIMEIQRRGDIDSESVNTLSEGKPSLFERFSKSKSQAVYAMRSVLREIAGEGYAVIVGRCGNIELKDRTDLLKVRIISDSESRISRIMREDKIERTQATNRIKHSDKERSEYAKHFFLVDVSNPELYDIVINTSSILPDVAARLIEQAVRQFGSTRPG